ncbi:MAG: hypothetical protein AB7N80_11435 [Bdellovibrionales bacterium]
MNIKLIFFGLCLSVVAKAVPDLRGQAQDQRRWAPIEVRLPENPEQVVASGYLTTKGTWRLNQIATQIEVKAGLISTYASQMGLSQFTKLCGRLGYGFAAVREMNRPFKLRVRVPDWSHAVAGLDGPQEIRLLKVRSRLAFDAQSNTLLYANLDPRKLERWVEAQVQAKIDELRARGEIVIDIQGHDYLACDYIAGTAHLGLEVMWEYPAAKIKRQPTLGEEDLNAVFSRAKAQYSSQSSCPDSLILSSAVLTASLTSMTRKAVDEVGMQSYLALFNAVYDSSACRWKDGRDVHMTEVAQEFDQLSEEKKQVTTKVFSRFSGELQ